MPPSDNPSHNALQAVDDALSSTDVEKVFSNEVDENSKWPPSMFLSRYENGMPSQEAGTGGQRSQHGRATKEWTAKAKDKPTLTILNVLKKRSCHRK
jgi:hypothetical protein